MYLKKLNIERQSLLIQKLQNIQDYTCLICLDLAINPVSCKGCKSKYCITCACNWKYNHNQCPKKCQTPWEFQNVNTLDLKIRCPFSKQCALMIPQLIQEHIAKCMYAPEQIISIRTKRIDYKCQKNHLLEFWTGTYQQMINAICAQCNQKTNCRSRCCKCDVKYCVQCRPPLCTKTHCPQKHKFIFKKKVGNQYICDLCNLKPQYFGKGVYQDIKCNFGICEFCYSKAPEKIQAKLHINKQDFCENNHFLEYLKEKQYSKCSHCQHEARISRVCKSCQLQFCIKCKPPYINCYNMCIKQHIIQNTMNKSCCFCQIQFNYGYLDSQCGFGLCRRCYIYFLQQAQFKQKITHTYCPSCSRDLVRQSDISIKKQCKICSKTVKCPLYCPPCNNYICYNCKPPLIDYEDYYRHDIKQLQRCNVSFCLSCDQQIRNGFGCNPCNFALCKKCFYNRINQAKQ